MNFPSFSDYIKTTLVVLCLDSVYLGLLGPHFKKLIASIQHEKMTLNYVAAGACYMLLCLMIAKFVITDRLGDLEAFLLGFCSYALFDLTNMAVFKKWDPVLSIIDMVWGGCLFFLTGKVVRAIS